MSSSPKEGKGQILCGLRPKSRNRGRMPWMGLEVPSWGGNSKPLPLPTCKIWCNAVSFPSQTFRNGGWTPSRSPLLIQLCALLDLSACACMLPQWDSGQSHGRKRILMHFELEHRLFLYDFSWFRLPGGVVWWVRSTLLGYTGLLIGFRVSEERIESQPLCVSTIFSALLLNSPLTPWGWCGLFWITESARFPLWGTWYRPIVENSHAWMKL